MSSARRRGKEEKKKKRRKQGKTVWVIAITDAIEASIAMGTTQPLDEERCLVECPEFVSDQCHFEQG